MYQTSASTLTGATAQHVLQPTRLRTALAQVQVVMAVLGRPVSAIELPGDVVIAPSTASRSK